MKLLIAMLLVSSNAFAINYFIDSEHLDSPFYESLDSLYMEMESPRSGLAKLEFLNINNEVEGNFVKRLRSSDLSDCSGSYCKTKLLTLPLNLKKATCRIKIAFNEEEKILSWGACKALGSKPSERFLPDFRVSNSAYYDLNNKLSVENLGASSLNKNLEIWGFIKNEKNEVIWKGMFRSSENFLMNTIKEISFYPELKKYQFALGCNASFIIDPHYNLFEKNKINNVITLPFGNCERTPSFENSDRFDFVPSVLTTNGKVIVSLSNEGRLSFTDNSSKIETRIELFNQSERVWVQQVFSRAPLHGFSDQKEIYTKTINADWCRIVIEVNPHFILKESDYLNNKIEYNFCI